MPTFMILPTFMIYALLAGLGLSFILGPIGCFVVWRRISFIGDTMTHSAIAGVALALLIDTLPFWGILAIAILIAVILSIMQRQRWLPLDTWLAILAHSLLAIGLVIFAMAKGGSIDLHNYLFGDILTISKTELIWLFAGVFATSGIFILLWKSLLVMTINTDLAKAEGIQVQLINLLFMLIIAVIVAFSVRLIGVLLLTAMMILPAATARAFSKTPTQMVILSVLFGMLSVTLGLFLSLKLDTPTGPTIVVGAFALFLASQVYKACKSTVIRS